MRETGSSKSWWENPKVVIWILAIVACAGLLFVFAPVLDVGWFGKPPADKVSFYVTGVGVPLLTFAGFLAVYLGFLSQREQNELQKRQIEAQQKNFQKDRFESTFFQLLRTHNQIVNDTRCEENRLWLSGSERRKLVEMRGRSCFANFYKELEELYEEKADEQDWTDPENREDGDVRTEEGKARWVYENWFSERRSEVNHYFSHLAKIISFVHRSDIQDKEFYIGLLSAQMSEPELKLFFYHVNLKKNESEHRHLRDAHDVLGEYTFFEQIDRRSLIHDQHYQLNKEALGM